MYYGNVSSSMKSMAAYMRGKGRKYRTGMPKLHARRPAFVKKISSNAGFGTVEVVILIAVVVGIALLFRTAIIDFAEGVIDNMFPSDTGVFDNSSI